jgi:5-formyltetrahydrofolate cyclo-ligase
MDKQTVRERVWDELAEREIARFPYPPHGRIPNVEGADRAASRLSETPEWDRADAVKCNPDSPQRPVRAAALAAGKTVYMARPRLTQDRPFLEIDPADVTDPADAATLSGSEEYGVPVEADSVDVDLVVSGSVAVRPDGARIGKGEGFADLEWGVLSGLGLVGSSTPVVTTVHERQVREEPWTPADHDVPLDLLVTAERVHRTDAGDRPTGIEWSALSAERIAETPVLRRLREE